MDLVMVDRLVADCVADNEVVTSRVVEDRIGVAGWMEADKRQRPVFRMKLVLNVTASETGR